MFNEKPNNSKHVMHPIEDPAEFSADFLRKRIAFLENRLHDFTHTGVRLMIERSIEINREILEIISGGKHVVVFDMGTMRKRSYRIY